MIPLSIYIKKVKIDSYHHRQLFCPVSQIDIQRIMHGFLADGHSIVIISSVLLSLWHSQRR